MPYNTFTIAERPDYRAQLPEIEGQVWPAFMLESTVAARYWDRLFTDLGDYQTVFVDQAGSVIAAGMTIPFLWDGDLATLPEGWDAVLELGFAQLDAGLAPNALSALSAVIRPGHQGQGISAEILKAMRRIGLERGFRSMVAPVRPTLKSLYPLIPIEQYVTWTRPDGLPFDPWMRVHARLGAEVLAPAPRSMYYTGTVEEWEKWTGLYMPVSGEYVAAGALQPISIDRETDRGVYYDPNVWMRHALADDA
ncbi:MAG TPA: GNAT family N-acetyltransferase [Chloroflexia bacterium]|nr:GNAT family N-acetyltransferase [Chloroflexia bacterium]